MGAHQVDAADLGDLALGHRDADADAVPLERRHGGLHLRGVQPARQVLALDLELGVLEHRPVEDAAFGHADVAQHLAHRVGLELLHAGEIDRGDRRALLDVDHEDIALHLEAHVLEEARGVERAQRGLRLLLVHGLADLHREVAEHRARLGALQALDADVPDGEGLERLRLRRGRECKRKRGKHRGQTSVNHQPVIRRLRSL